MMPTYTDPYLERYREKIRRRASGSPSKPPKGAFEGFEGEGVARPENFTDKPTEVTRKTFKSHAPTWRLADLPADQQAAEARRRLDSQGWVGILARRIGDDAVVLLAEDPAKVPANLARRWPVFTLAEVQVLLPAGLEAVRAAHRDKLAAIEEAGTHA